MKTFERCLYLCWFRNLRDFHGKLQSGTYLDEIFFLLDEVIILNTIKNKKLPQTTVIFFQKSSFK